MSWRSGSTCTSRSARRAATTATSPPGPTAPTSSTSTSTRASATSSSATSPTPSSVFFGGGTPSLLDAPALAAILDAIPRAADAEVTVECNPDSVDLAKLRAYAAAGVNRVSFGVQSMRAHVLAALGRTHDPDNVARARRRGHATRGSTASTSTSSTARPASPSPTGRRRSTPPWRSSPSTSAPTRSRWSRARRSGRRSSRARAPRPTTTTRPRSTSSPTTVLTAAGLPWYEMSNWARPGEECRHNLLYWQGGDYAAIGCAAHGHRGAGAGGGTCARRSATSPRSPPVPRPRRGRDPRRRRPGRRAPGPGAADVVAGSSSRAPGADPSGVATCIDDLSDVGLLARSDDRVVLTRRGRLLGNEVAARLLAALEQPSPVAGTR